MHGAVSLNSYNSCSWAKREDDTVCPLKCHGRSGLHLSSWWSSITALNESWPGELRIFCFSAIPSLLCNDCHLRAGCKPAEDARWILRYRRGSLQVEGSAQPHGALCFSKLLSWICRILKLFGIEWAISCKVWEELACIKGSLFSPPLKCRAFGGSSDF